MTSAAEPTDDSQLGGRLPLLTPAELDSEQARLRDQLAATRGAEARAAGFALELPGGEVIGPFNAFLRVPGIFQALQQWAGAIRHYDLPADVQQVAILTVGAAWHSDYEVYAHTAEARHAGVPDSDVDAIVAGGLPVGLSGGPASRTAWPWLWPATTPSATTFTRRPRDVRHRAADRSGQPDRPVHEHRGHAGLLRRPGPARLTPHPHAVRGQVLNRSRSSAASALWLGRDERVLGLRCTASEWSER